MNGTVADVAWSTLLVVAALNPFRLPGAAVGSSRRAVNVGALFVAVLLVVLGLIAEPLVGWLDVSVATFRLATGIVVGVGGVRDLLRPWAPQVPGRGELFDALVPVAVPHLVVPGLVMAVLTVDLDRGLVSVVIASVLAAMAGASALQRPASGPAVAAGARLTGGLAVLLGVGLGIEGVLSV